MTATKKLSRCPTDTLNHTPLKVLILSKMYRHDFNYIRASLLTGNGLSEATTTGPEDANSKTRITPVHLTMINVLIRRVLKWDAQPLI